MQARAGTMDYIIVSIIHTLTFLFPIKAGIKCVFLTSGPTFTEQQRHLWSRTKASSTAVFQTSSCPLKYS